MHMTKRKYWAGFDFLSTRDGRTVFRRELLSTGML